MEVLEREGSNGLGHAKAPCFESLMTSMRGLSINRIEPGHCCDEKSADLLLCYHKQSPGSRIFTNVQSVRRE